MKAIQNLFQSLDVTKHAAIQHPAKNLITPQNVQPDLSLCRAHMSQGTYLIQRAQINLLHTLPYHFNVNY